MLVLVIVLIWPTGVKLHAQPVGAPPEQQAIDAIEQLGGRIYRSANNEVEIISLDGTRATDEDLKLLQSFPSLRTLDLDHCNVTDQGLEHLMKLPGLQEVSLRGTKVTQAAAI